VGDHAALVVRRCSLEDLHLDLRDPQLAAQPHKLVTFAGGQPIGAAALVEVGLLDPAAQAAVRDPEILGDLADRFLAHPGQLDDPSAELGRMWTWHLDSSP